MPTSVLRPTLGRAAVGMALAVLLATVHVPGRPSTACVLRGLTGIPCPFCGGTTAAAAVGRLDLMAALRASPAAVAGAAAFVLAPLLPHLPPVRGRWLIAFFLGFAELWQLARFGLL